MIKSFEILSFMVFLLIIYKFMKLIRIYNFLKYIKILIDDIE